MYSQDIGKKNAFDHFNIKTDNAKISIEKRNESHKEMLSGLTAAVDNTDKHLYQLHRHFKKHIEGNIDNQAPSDELENASPMTLFSSAAPTREKSGQGTTDPHEQEYDFFKKEGLNPDSVTKADASGLLKKYGKIDTVTPQAFEMIGQLKKINSRLPVSDAVKQSLRGTLGQAEGNLSSLKMPVDSLLALIKPHTSADMNDISFGAKKLSQFADPKNLAQAGFVGQISGATGIPEEALMNMSLYEIYAAINGQSEAQNQINNATGALKNYGDALQQVMFSLPDPASKPGSAYVPPSGRKYRYSGDSDNAMQDAANLMSEYADLSQEKLSHKNAELNRILQELSEKVKKTTTLQNIQTQLQAIANKDNTNPSVRDLLYDAKKNPNGVSEATIDKWAAAVGMNPEDLKNEKLQDFEDLISTAQQDENDQKNMKQQLQVDIQTDLGYVQMAIQSASSIVRDLVSLLKALAQALAG